jgi:hypothetical protein
MCKKAPRPPILGDRVGRARNHEGFGDAFNSQNSNTEDQRQGDISARLPIVWPINGVRAPGGASARLARMMEATQAHAFALQGPRAFHCPKPSAAFHEAGHAVFYAKSGVVPSKITIWPILVSGQQQWIGKTYCTPGHRVDVTTSAESYLRNAQEWISGVTAECLFHREYRAGSSLDEIVLAIAAVGSAALKMQTDAELLWFETLAAVATILKANEDTVRKIADELMRKWTIKSRRLACLLRGIRND